MARASASLGVAQRQRDGAQFAGHMKIGSFGVNQVAAADTDHRGARDQKHDAPLPGRARHHVEFGVEIEMQARGRIGVAKVEHQRHRIGRHGAVSSSPYEAGGVVISWETS